MKTCFKCLSSLALSEFYRHPEMADGLLGKCKECTKKDTARDRMRKSSDPQWVARERRKAVERAARTRRRLQAVHDPKYLAQRAFSVAVHRGRIAKPDRCERCQAACERHRLHGHHEDYSKRYSVMWLCWKCHAAVHKEKRGAVTT